MITEQQQPATPPQLEVVIEIPRGSFLKRGSTGELDFISPFPCPFNYGSVENYIGLEGDLLDAVVLGPRLQRGERVIVHAVGFPVILFFRFYAKCKGILNFFRGRPGRNACNGWGDASEAIARARPCEDGPWKGSVIPF
jgi:inorganic pyrophosphatase